MYTLQLLHASDLEGGVDAIGDAPNFATVVDALDDLVENTIILSAGDNYLSGPFFNAAASPDLQDELQAALEAQFGLAPGDLAGIEPGAGFVDIAIMNIIGFDASALGNHEFDLGTATLANAISAAAGGATLADISWLGARFPYLSSNLDFSADANLAALFTASILPSTDFANDPDDVAAGLATPLIAPATVIEEGGELIGVVGATTQLLETISSPGDTVETTGGVEDMAALAAVLQPVVDQMIAGGVNKIVLVSHLQQIALETELAGLLSGVDIIVAGGSDTLLADGNDALRTGDVAADTYPREVTDANGNPLLIVSTDGEYSYVGRLVVTFDDNGVIDLASLDDTLNGAYATDEAGVLAATGAGDLATAIANSAKGSQVQTLTAAVSTVVEDAAANAFGFTDVYLDGRRGEVRTEETNLGDLTADANLWFAQQSDETVQVSIKNGGGIRDDIGDVVLDGFGGISFEPPFGNAITELDVQNSLRFDNQLSLVTVSTEDLLALLNHGVEASMAGATPGQFPQVGGVRFFWNPDRAPGDRVTGVALIDEQGAVTQWLVENGEVLPDAPDAIRVVTLNFLADGGDGYDFPGLGEDRADLGVGEQQAMQEFLATNHATPETAFAVAETDPAFDNRIKPNAAPIDTTGLVATRVARFDSGVGEGGSEVVAHEGGRLYVTNGAEGRIDVFDIATDSIVGFIDLTILPGFGGVQSVAVRNGLVAVAVAGADDAVSGDPQPGSIAIYDAETLAQVGAAAAGFLPDMVTFSADGSQIYAANEGEGDPAGSVSIIDIDAAGNVVASVNVGFGAFDGQEEALRNEGVRIFPGASPSTDFEPEYIAIDPNTGNLIVTLQEANAFAIIDPAAKEVIDIVSAGTLDHSRGLPTLQTFDFGDLPLLGTDANGLDIDLGGFSGLWFVEETDSTISFLTVPDRGPNGGEVVDGARTFNLPDYQARVVRLDLDKATGTVSIGDTVFLTQSDGITPITGLPNIEGFDEIPVDAAGNPLAYDPFGADMEGIVVDDDGTFWTVDEYRPAIYHFAADGSLIDRFVPEGTSLLGTVPQPEGSFGSETLPEVYNTHRSNRGFEAVAADLENDTLYAFIQTPLANPDGDASAASQVIRILAIDMNTGEPTAEYVYGLERPELRPGGVVDKIGDAVFDPSTGHIYVVERDSEIGTSAMKPIFEIDLSGATDVLGMDFGAETLEQQTLDDLAGMGIRPVAKTEVVNPPSLGYTASDKIEGLALLPDGSLAILNDNDFGIEEATGLLPQLGIISFGKPNGFDASDEDGGIFIAPRETQGLRMADAVAAFTAGGLTYFATANEGDDRGDFDEGGDAARVGDILAGEVFVFGTGETLSIDPGVNTEGLERLTVSIVDGDTDGDGDIDVLHSYGSRSFTIYDAFGNVVFDSGSDFERIIAEVAPSRFNDDDDELDEDRSDNKGPEPEAVAVGEVGGQLYAFIGLERDSGIMVYNVTDPANSHFVTYIDGIAGGDVSPEVITFIEPGDSTTGNAQVAIAYEVSGTTSVYDLEGALILEGGPGRDNLVGGAAGDELSGGGGKDSLDGGAGNDILAGGTGKDRLWGREGADTFVFANGDGRDVVYDFEVGIDLIDLTAVGGVSGFDDLTIRGKGGDALIKFAGGSVKLLDVPAELLDADSFLFDSV